MKKIKIFDAIPTLNTPDLVAPAATTSTISTSSNNSGALTCTTLLFIFICFVILVVCVLAVGVMAVVYARGGGEPYVSPREEQKHMMIFGWKGLFGMKQMGVWCFEFLEYFRQVIGLR